MSLFAVKGAKFARWNGTDEFDLICQISSMNHSGASAESIETTHFPCHDDAVTLTGDTVADLAAIDNGGWSRKTQGKKDAGNFSIEVDWDPIRDESAAAHKMNQKLLENDFNTGATGTYRLILPDERVTLITFRGHISEFNWFPNGDPSSSENIGASFSIAIDGQWIIEEADAADILLPEASE